MHDPAARCCEDPEQPRAATKDALAYAVPVTTGKIGLEYGRRFWEEDDQIFGGITNTNIDLSTIWYPSYGYLGEQRRRRRLLQLRRQRGQLRRLTARRSAWHGRSRRAARSTATPTPTSCESSFSVAWQKIRYSEGGWVSWPSRTSGQYARLLEPDGNVYFAGDHLSYYIAWQAGAVESARKVVMQIHDRVVRS